MLKFWELHIFSITLYVNALYSKLYLRITDPCLKIIGVDTPHKVLQRPTSRNRSLS